MRDKIAMLLAGDCTCTSCMTVAEDEADAIRVLLNEEGFRGGVGGGRESMAVVHFDRADFAKLMATRAWLLLGTGPFSTKGRNPCVNR